MQTIDLDENTITELLYHLTEETSEDGNIPERNIKRGLRLDEVSFDIKKRLEAGEEFSPADFIRSFGLLQLFVLEYQGMISFQYEDVFEWNKFKKSFYDFTEIFSEVFELKKGRGRPNKSETVLLYFLGLFCRSHNLPTCDHRYACNCNYFSLLSDVQELRLARSKSWQARTDKKSWNANPEQYTKLSHEEEKIFWDEYRAAKIAVDRFWKKLYKKQPPRFESKDKARLKQFVIENDIVRHRQRRKAI